MIDQSAHEISDLGGRLAPFQGHMPSLPASAFLFAGAQLIGDVVVGDQTSIWHGAVLRGDVNFIRVGRRSNIQDGTIVHVSTNRFPTLIGDDVLVAHRALLHGCVLKDRAFVGMGAIVMDGAVIEPDGMLAAGGLLPPGKIIQAGALWVGSPAQFLRHLTVDEIEKNRAMADHYHKLALQHRLDAQGIKASKPYPDLKR